jgi:hypothetical protein
VALDTAIPGLAGTLATYLPAYVSDLGHVFDQVATDPTPDSVTLSVGKTAILFVPKTGVFDTDGQGGRWPTMGSGGHFTDEETVSVIALIGLYDQRRVGTLLAKARPYPHAIRAVIRAHNRLGLDGADPLWRSRATDYIIGATAWGGADYLAVNVTVNLSYDEQLTPGS